MSSPSPTQATVVLVHGAWADASSWREVIACLHRAGLPVVAVQNPTTSLASDVAATRTALDNIDGPVVLVGHSWGGTVITEAGNDPKVRALVFVAALAPDAGQSTGDLVAAHPAPPGLGMVSQDRAGNLVMRAEGFVRHVAQDLPEADARVLAAVAPPLGAGTFGDKISQAAWATRPNWFIVATQDQAVDVGLQRALAARLRAQVTELPTSHMPLLSAPQAVADVIAQAVRACADA